MPQIQRGKAIGTLTRLKAEGVISDFRTSLFGKDAGIEGSEVIITAVGNLDQAAMQRLALQVMEALEPLVGDVAVTVLRDPHSKSRG